MLEIYHLEAKHFVRIAGLANNFQTSACHASFFQFKTNVNEKSGASYGKKMKVSKKNVHGHEKSIQRSDRQAAAQAGCFSAQTVQIYADFTRFYSCVNRRHLWLTCNRRCAPRSSEGRSGIRVLLNALPLPSSTPTARRGRKLRQKPSGWPRGR
jgi:hypothetical protein